MQREKDIFTDLQLINDRPFIGTDLFRLICGEKLGEGQYRCVYDCNIGTGNVIKICADPFENICEWKIWESVKEVPSHAKWFTPCVQISPCGHFLIQKKVKPLPEKFKYPTKLPCLFTDLKPDNWGLLKGRLVCHDYQFISSMVDCSMASRRKTQWHFQQ